MCLLDICLPMQGSQPIQSQMDSATPIASLPRPLPDSRGSSSQNLTLLSPVGNGIMMSSPAAAMEAVCEHSADLGYMPTSPRVAEQEGEHSAGSMLDRSLVLMPGRSEATICGACLPSTVAAHSHGQPTAMGLATEPDGGGDEFPTCCSDMLPCSTEKTCTPIAATAACAEAAPTSAKGEQWSSTLEDSTGNPTSGLTSLQTAEPASPAQDAVASSTRAGLSATPAVRR